MGGIERLRHLRDDRRSTCRIERPFAKDGLQIRSLDVAHGDEQLPLHLTRRVDRHDIRVLEMRGDAALASEALPETRICRQGRRDELQSDAASDADLFGRVHDTHAASTGDREHAVPGEDVAGHELVAPRAVDVGEALRDPIPLRRVVQQGGGACEQCTGCVGILAEHRPFACAFEALGRLDREPPGILWTELGPQLRRLLEVKRDQLVRRRALLEQTGQPLVEVRAPELRNGLVDRVTQECMREAVRLCSLREDARERRRRRSERAVCASPRR